MPLRRVVTGRSQDPRKRFREELCALRAQHDYSYRRLGDLAGWDPSLFSKMESGDTLGGPEVVQALDQLYGTPRFLITLWELAIADPSQFREQYRRYMRLEAEAVSLWHYGVSSPPGLLQTERYAREALMAGGLRGKDLNQQVEARIGRHKLLEGDDAPPFRSILSEAVLRHGLRDADAWREQLEYLVEAADRPDITLHVLPFGTGPHGLINTDTWFLRMPEGHTVAYIENDVRGELIGEAARVERLQRAYDAMRDLVLTPAESRKFITRMLEGVPCDPSI